MLGAQRSGLASINIRLHRAHPWHEGTLWREKRLTDRQIEEGNGGAPWKSVDGSRAGFHFRDCHCAPRANGQAQKHVQSRVGQLPRLAQPHDSPVIAAPGIYG